MSKNEYVVGENNTPKKAPAGPLGGHGPGARSFEKPKNFKTAIVHLIKYCKKYWAGLLLAMICAVASTIILIISPRFLQQITDVIEGGLATGIDMELINAIALTLVILMGSNFIIYYFDGFIMATVTQKLAKSLRSDLSSKINKLPLAYFDKTTYGDILSRMTNDVDTVAHTLNQSLTGLISGVLMIIGSAVMMFITNWILALTAIFASLLGFGLMSLIIGKSQKYFVEQQKYLGEVNGHIEEIYAGHNVVKVYNAEKIEHEKFEEINQKLRKSNWKAQFASGIMQPLMGFIGNIGYLAVCVVGGALAFGGHIGFGVIVSFMLYIRMFTQPLTSIAQAATQMQSTAASSERVFEFLNEKEMLKDSADAKLNNVVGDITFDHVKFGYDADKMIINDFSCEVKGGQKIAIVGPTGAGKTTMVNLLMRFYELNDGDIKIDKVPISNLSRNNVHELFGMVLQDTWLFEGSIKDNVKYSKIEATDEDVVKACKAVGLHHFIKTLDDGYDTILDDTLSLSQGQKQLVTIARAMVENAPMLILDEATSSVDTRTELLIQKAMDQLMVGRTSFIIAHRLSTIKNADLILVMKDGDVIEKGSHNELISQNGFYANLYNSQFANQ